jgi:hypothetical protein
MASSQVVTTSGELSFAQTTQPNAYLDALYKNAVIDARDPQPDEVLLNLTAINESNLDLRWEGKPGKSRILVVTLVTLEGASTYKEGKQVTDREIWVTAHPELQKFCRQYQQITKANTDQLNLRLKQLLGLPPTRKYTHVVEIWVDPQYLKRPSLDPEIIDREVQPIPNPIPDPLPFPEGIDEAYKAWFTSQIKEWKENRENSYPWTGLGYTYDWSRSNPKTNLQTDAGLSEFVILPNSKVSTPIEVMPIKTTDEFCK